MALFMRSSNWEQSKYSSAGEWINNPYNGILFCNKSEGTTNICNNRDLESILLSERGQN